MQTSIISLYCIIYKIHTKKKQRCCKTSYKYFRGIWDFLICRLLNSLFHPQHNKCNNVISLCCNMLTYYNTLLYCLYSKETRELFQRNSWIVTGGVSFPDWRTYSHRHWLYYISTVRDVDAHWWIQLSVTRTRRSLALRL